MKRLALLTTAALGLALLVLYGCRDTTEVTGPSTAVTAATYTLTITGSGTGSGVVKSTPTGITCTITNGQAASTGCTKAFPQGQTVTLTATPAAGTAFGGWLNVLACKSLGSCTFKLTSNRTVPAVFRKGPFTVKITSGSQGPGTGRVTSQSGLTPALNCLITNGTPAATGCSATYPANTVLTLRATANSGSVFNGWGLPTCGTAACQVALIQGMTIPATFAVASPSSPAVQGKWDPAFTTPSVIVHAHLLRTGKVLVWGDNGTAYLWSATTGFASVTKPYRIYCTGHTFLPGRPAPGHGRHQRRDGRPPGREHLQPVHQHLGRHPARCRGAATIRPRRRCPTAKCWSCPATTRTRSSSGRRRSGAAAAGASCRIPRWPSASPYYPPMFVAPNGKVFMAGFAQQPLPGRGGRALGADHQPARGPPRHGLRGDVRAGQDPLRRRR